MTHTLPTGLVYHCATCGLVVPSDAPTIKPALGDCAFVAKHKLSWFNPDETIKGQHTQATACWALIHDKAVRSSAVDARSDTDAQDYIKWAKDNAKNHFRSSAAFKALSTDQIKEQTTPDEAVDCHLKIRSKQRDAWVYHADDARES
jgi:hypothetical protein